MPKFQIKYAGNGRLENAEWETIECNTLEQANLEAWQMASEDFNDHCYAYLDEDEMTGLSEEEQEQIWHETSEMVIAYDARPYQ